MNVDGFIRNAWYVIGLSEEFDRSLSPRRILGEDVVIWRAEDGTAAALEDACPHRKLPLSQGRLVGDRIECGYHGLTFSAEGACVAAPTQPDSIPARARVPRYPTLDRYGFLWIWMGDESLADPALILDIPHFDDSAWGQTRRGKMPIACHYLWITDNLLDPSHVAWVHVGSFGGAGTENQPLTLTDTDGGLIVWRWIGNRPPPPYYAPFLAFEGTCDRKQHYECRLPGIAINKSVYTPAGTGGDDDALPPEAFVNYSFNFMTPVDADNSLYFWFQHRNSRPQDDVMSERMFEGARAAFEEDRVVLESVHRGMKDPRRPALNLGLDAAAMRFRRMVERTIDAERA